MNLPYLKYKTLLLTIGVLLIILPNILLLYLMMPMPGSQEFRSVSPAYFIYNFKPFYILIGVILVIIPVLNIAIYGSIGKKVWLFFLTLVCVSTSVLSRKFSAPTLFKEPVETNFLTPDKNQLPASTIVLGIERNGIAKAYPVKLLAYHHQVKDKIGDENIIATYCTMCRTGNIFSTIFNNKNLELDLIGALQYNATFREKETGSWWCQATGDFIAGPLKGEKLNEILCEQVTLASWLSTHPNSLIMQPDPNSGEGYKMFGFASFDKYRDRKRESADRIFPRNWVVGIEVNNEAKAYLWSNLVKERSINDILNNTPIVLALESDTLSFHSWNRSVNGKTLTFSLDNTNNLLDTETRSNWNWKGECTEGELKGQKLQAIIASQEYYNSWKTFHPSSTFYKQQ